MLYSGDRLDQILVLLRGGIRREIVILCSYKFRDLGRLPKYRISANLLWIQGLATNWKSDKNGGRPPTQERGCVLAQAIDGAGPDSDGSHPAVLG